MPYTSHFYPEHHLSYIRLYGSTTVQDALDIYHRNLKLYEEVETPIHVLLDLSAVERFPTSIREMREVLTPIESPKLWWMVIVVDANPVLKFIISTTTQIVSKKARFRLVDSLGEAFVFLKDVDSTLDVPVLELELQHLP